MHLDIIILRTLLQIQQITTYIIMFVKTVSQIMTHSFLKVFYVIFKCFRGVLEIKAHINGNQINSRQIFLLRSRYLSKIYYPLRKQKPWLTYFKSKS